jgi:DNA polymerase IIIc chi subunit
MNPEVNFYQTDEATSKSIAPLLLKILSEKKRVLILCKDKNLTQEIDTALWNYGRNKFIPHAVASDDNFDPARQPVLISDVEENKNSADFLLFVDEPSAQFLSSFARVFYFFEDGKNISKIKPTNFYKKVDGKWIKA